MSLKKANHFNEKKIVFCSRTCKKNLHETYDGEYGSITKEVKTNTRKNPYNYDFILIVSDDRKTTSLKEQYDEFILDADALKEATKGFINMYKTGYITNTARNLFATFCKIEPESIESYETEYFNNTGAGLRIGEPYTGSAYKYDFKSFYPSIYYSLSIMFPIAKGTLKTITQETFDNYQYIPYGVYRAKITTKLKYFWDNPNYYYSHYELTYARELGLTIEILGDCIVWDRSQLKTGKEIFYKYTKYLYDLKEKKVRGAKTLLNVIWGSLCKTTDYKYVHDCTKNGIYDIKENMNVKELVFLNDDFTKFEVHYNRPKHVFDTPWARIKPFLIGKARVIMGKTIQPYADSIVFCHTDSMISKIKLPVKTGDKIGNLSYEGYCSDAVILNKAKRSGKYVQ